MRTTIVIDDTLLEELILTSDSKSRSAAISEAVSDYVSRKKREGILELKGKIRFEEAHLERYHYPSVRLYNQHRRHGKSVQVANE